MSAKKDLPDIEKNIEVCSIFATKEIFNRRRTYYLKHKHKDGRNAAKDLAIWKLHTYSWSQALYDWFTFTEPDIVQFRAYVYQSALWKYLSHRLSPGIAVYGKDCSTFHTILSNDENLIHWYSQYLWPAFDSMVLRQAKDPDCMCLSDEAALGLQLRLVLQRDWKRVRERSLAALARPECFRRKNDLLLWKFYLALTEGDVKTMQKLVLSLTAADARQALGNNRFSDNAVALVAVIMAKLAYREGYELDVETPWIPTEWLGDDKPDTSLLMDEVKDIDVFQPLEIEIKGEFNKDYSHLNPRPIGQPPLTFDDFWQFFKGDARPEYYYKKRW